MAHDWKTLSMVALGAAVAGWIVVRAMTAVPPERPPSAEAVLPARATTERPVAAEEAAAPARPLATGEAPPAADADAIVLDLEGLSRALVRDQRVEDRVLPRINDALDVPGVTAYRRAPDFWEPALAGSEGDHR
ncbi:MAG: hypothetical protein IT294_04030 [Deltaproteobacteria bacterium]|nr:hypothetical protein [Deltaproteobacteria bacterium]